MGIENTDSESIDQFWPEINKSIVKLVDLCVFFFATNKNSNHLQTLKPYCAPPWSCYILVCDQFKLCGHQYLLFIKHYNKEPILRPIQYTSSTGIIFKDLAIPWCVVTDSGSTFTRENF